MPWVVSNPIYVGLRPSSPRVPEVFTKELAQFDGTSASWAIERAPTSEGRVDVAHRFASRPALRFTWRLGDGKPSGQYAALVVPIHGASLKDFRDLVVTASSQRPMRMSVQLRVPESGGLRWQRSVYVDPLPRDIDISLKDMTAIEAGPGAQLDLSKADTLLFVVDTVNAAPGSEGETWIADVRWRLR